MFIDEVKIYLKAGDGGKGSFSFIKKQGYKTIGSGGCGGKGADIIIKVNTGLYDLSKFKYKRKFKADNGAPGSSNNKTGKSAKDLFIEVPPGTLIKNQKGQIIADLAGPSSQFLAAKGGRGGRGNYKNQSMLPPQEGEEVELVLDYRIPNDIALVGFPNCGKTSLFNLLTGQKAKVASYPFTTRFPFWSQLNFEGKQKVILDLPAVSEEKDSAEKNNLGFLKHLWRSEAVFFMASAEGNFNRDFSLLRQILLGYDRYILNNKQIHYIISKTDRRKIEQIQQKGYIFISAEAQSAGAVKELIIKRLWQKE